MTCRHTARQIKKIRVGVKLVFCSYIYILRYLGYKKFDCNIITVFAPHLLRACRPKESEILEFQEGSR